MRWREKVVRKQKPCDRHGNEWNDIICNIVKFMASSEARGHDMMIRLHNMIVMSWNVDHLWRLYFATIFRIHPSLFNSPDYEMTIPEQNEYNTAPPSTDTEQQSLAGSLTSQPSSSAAKSRKPRSERQSRHKWSDEDKKTLMTLYYRSDPSKSGYRRRLHSL